MKDFKDFNDFAKGLDSYFWSNLEKAINQSPEVANAPNIGARIHCETIIIATTIIGAYHEWLHQ